MDWKMLLNNPIIQDLGIAVIGGILVLIMQYIFLSYILPIYIGKSQKLTNFDGTKWLGYPDTDDLGSEPRSTLNIIQTGNKISAIAIRNASSGERKFKYTGTMYGNQIVLEFFDEQGPGLIVGTMILHIGSNLKKLKGLSTYYHHDSGKVVSTRQTFIRK